MHVHIVGAGAIGLLVAYHLKRSGHHVTLLTRTKEQAKEILSSGIVVTNKGQFANLIDCHAEEVDRSLPLEGDLLIFTVKSYQVKSALQIVKKRGFSYRAMLFLPNGMEHIDVVNQLKGQLEVGIGVVEHGAIKEGFNEVNHTGRGRIRWSIIQGESQVIRNLMNSINKEQFPTVEMPNWLEVLESKLIVNVCINPLTALFNCKNEELINNTYYHSIMRMVFEEAIQVLHLDNHEEKFQMVEEVCRNTANNQSSMLVDLTKGRKVEIDAITGYLVKKAKSLQVETPIIHMLHQSIKGKEKGGRGV